MFWSRPLLESLLLLRGILNKSKTTKTYFHVKKTTSVGFAQNNGFMDGYYREKSKFSATFFPVISHHNISQTNFPETFICLDSWKANRRHINEDFLHENVNLQPKLDDILFV